MVGKGSSMYPVLEELWLEDGGHTHILTWHNCTEPTTYSISRHLGAPRESLALGLSILSPPKINNICLRFFSTLCREAATSFVSFIFVNSLIIFKRWTVCFYLKWAWKSEKEIKNGCRLLPVFMCSLFISVNQDKSNISLKLGQIREGKKQIE
jgi:hypothetical protein